MKNINNGFGQETLDDLQREPDKGKDKETRDKMLQGRKKMKSTGGLQ